LANNFGVCENNLAKLVYAMCREAGIKICVQIFWWARTRKIWEGKNVQNSARFRTTLNFDREYLWNGSRYQQDHQALLKAKYCTRVAAAACTQKNTKNPCDLDLWSMTLKSNRVLEVVELAYMFRQNFIKLSAAVHDLSWSQRKKLRRRPKQLLLSDATADSKSEKQVINYNGSHVGWKNGPTLVY